MELFARRCRMDATLIVLLGGLVRAIRRGIQGALAFGNHVLLAIAGMGSRCCNMDVGWFIVAVLGVAPAIRRNVQAWTAIGHCCPVLLLLFVGAFAAFGTKAVLICGCILLYLWHRTCCSVFRGCRCAAELVSKSFASGILTDARGVEQ